jgi:glutathione S-transferase
MDLLGYYPAKALQPEVSRDVQRIVAIWNECRDKYTSDGPFLLGAFSIADAMYAPVVSRFRTFAINPADFGDNGHAATYAGELWQLPAMQKFRNRAEAELAG